MTTQAAAELYPSQHMSAWGHQGYAVFNPHDRPINSLPTIYGFNNGGTPGFLQGVILAEDGEVLGGHLCSAEGYMPHDLGVVEGSRPDRHEAFRAKYPDGYRMDFVPGDDVMTHPGLDAAVKAHTARATPTPADQ